MTKKKNNFHVMHARNQKSALYFVYNLYLFLHATTKKKCNIDAIADGNNPDYITIDIKCHIIASSGIQPFCVLLQFIEKYTSIDVDFAIKITNIAIFIPLRCNNFNTTFLNLIYNH